MHRRNRGHHALSHDSLSWLAYDWERTGDPSVPPRWPFKVYLPRTTQDVVRAVREVSGKLTVRGSGHSSNGLVTPEGGAVLLTELMDRVVAINEGSCTMQAGARLADVDRQLAAGGLGLQVIGDHEEISAGGFASVGGISAASHRFGLFVDTVSELEYVDYNGEVHRCARGDDELPRVLGGLGRSGVITELTVDVQQIDKQRTLLRNDRTLTGKLPEFVSLAAEMVRSPEPALYARALWVDTAKAGFGQISTYHRTSVRSDRLLRSRIAETYHRLVSAATTRLPASAGAMAKYAGVAGMVLPPVYTTVARVERFADDLADATVGGPTRMLIAIAPAATAAATARGMLDACAAARESGAVDAVALYIKPIRSRYLSGGRDDLRHAEITVTATVDPAKLTPDALTKLVDQIDRVALEQRAFRYMHTRTSEDPQRRRQLDPNAQYSDAPWPG